MATEFNEGHTILCTEFFSGGHHTSLTGPELVAVLACFIDDSDKDEMPSIDELNVPSAVRDALYGLGRIVSDCQKVETGRGVQGPDKYWNLSTRWIEPVWRWLHEENASIICQEYGVFEGNFVRSILRIANLVDESVAVATFTEDLETLEKLQDLNLVRDFLKPDSLYLHL
jgi:superfamily II RNA helicase